MRPCARWLRAEYCVPCTGGVRSALVAAKPAGFLVAAIAGVVTHVPAGLGVLEAVFVTLLPSRVPKEELLAVLLAYRAIYYLAPLVVAAVIYVLFEARVKRRAGAVSARP